MQKFIIHTGIILCFLASIFSSCYEDKGNYNYHEVDEVTIDTAGLGFLQTYVISRFDRLQLSPNIYMNGELVNDNTNAPLDYLWTIYTNTTSANSDYTVDTLGHKRVLDAEISRPAGTYNIRLTVTNRNDDIQSYLTIPCNIEETITAGWMLFYERADMPGTSDVGLVVNPWVKKNIIQNKEFWNLYGASNNQPLQGKPVRILHTVVSISNDFVIMVTDQDMAGVDQSTFNKALSFENFFFNAPDKCQISYYGTGGIAQRAELLINDNQIYTTTWNALSRDNFFGVAKTGKHGELAPWSSDVRSFNYDCVVYDQTNKKFLCVNRNDITLSSFAGQDMTACSFDVNDVGMTLLMGDWGRNYYDYLLMQKDNERYLAIANFNGSTASSQNIGLSMYNISNSPEIKDACTMAASYSGEYVLYGAGSKVYNLKYNSSSEAEVLWDAPNPNEKVTCVRLQKFYFTTLMMMMMPNANQILHIATYDETTNEGKLYQYQINPASGAIISEPRIYTVPGKVGDMAWKYVMEM